jgi:hypothetical protein
MATPATAPVSSLSLAAWAVPCPCETVPSANPLETGWAMASRSIRQGPKLEPGLVQEIEVSEEMKLSPPHCGCERSAATSRAAGSGGLISTSAGVLGRGVPC